MAIKITDACINCGACEPECPNTAIYEAGMPWNMAEGTSLRGNFTLMNGDKIDVDEKINPISEEFYYISPDKCTECKGFHEEPQCAAVCPVDCCVPNEQIKESEEKLLNKQQILHPKE